MASKKKDRQRCFVIMPIGKTTPEHTEHYWAEHFRVFLKPLIEDNPQVEAYRSKALRGDILREIITNLVVAPVVVADLTDHNPNVYWELGIRQSFKHATITIAQHGTKLPFDISGKGTLFYNPSDHLKLEDFRKEFKEAIKDCLEKPLKPDSHVLETLSGRGTLFEIFRRDEALRRLDAALSECKGNADILKRAVSKARLRQNKPEQIAFITERFGSSALELLITTRYVDEDEKFFSTLEIAANWIRALNEQLRNWPYRVERINEWFVTTAEDVTRVIEHTASLLSTARNKLSQRL